MKLLVFLAASLAAILARPSYAGAPATACTSDCKIENNCRCSRRSGPFDGDITEYPQLITLTFDDAVTTKTYQLWYDLLMSRTNPDGNAIGATFYVPHEYTDYQKVNELYNYGFEIAVHSITKNPLQSYWRTASENTLEQEFGGQKQIISKFANIPLEEIQGVRTPQLQLSGNNTIVAYRASDLSYDSSWPTLPSKPLFPYTLDYLSTQDCNLGSTCPNEAFPGFWVLPIMDLNGPHGGWCNSLSSCNMTGTADQIADWLCNEIVKVKDNTRVPLTLSVNSYWFEFTNNSLAGLTQCLDTLQDSSDVFLVTHKQVIDWVKNPVKLADFQTEDASDQVSNCNEYNCSLMKDGKTMYMKTCVSCPAAYPWLGNPNGDPK
uniref:Chitin deacetylase 1 n=1 Tax=Chrysomela tremula TaxID=63687 RepID=C3UTB8_CHRTR|nr:chitin deacetylase 1 [Chrysomela tremula]